MPSCVLPNEYKKEMKKQKIVDILKIRFLTERDSYRIWTKIGLFISISILLIYSSHLVDKKVFYISRLNNEVKELKAEYVEVRSQLQHIRLESTVKRELEMSGLKQSEHPPQKIKVIVR